MKNSKIKAYSLIEISVVLIIVGILLTGIIKGREIHYEMAITSAQSLTNSSPVAVIDGLEVWYETSKFSSFEKSERVNNASVSVWYDNNPQVAKGERRNATQTDIAKMPIYTKRAFDSLSGLYFDGSDDQLAIDGKFMVGSYYTFFLIEKRLRAGAAYFFRAGNWGTVSGSIHVGYRSDTLITLDHYATGLNVSVPAFSYPTAKLLTFQLDEEGKKIWIDGGGLPDASNAANDRLITNNSFSLGNSYNGYIAELIMFSRALQDKERVAIESYLAQKYKIKIK